MVKHSFAATLSDYYSRVGNRVLFRGGLSLNRLALEMWERLDYSGIDPSVISRVLRGERLFTMRQADVFCKVLDLDHEDTGKLKNALMNELIVRMGWGNFVADLENKSFLDLVRDNVNKIDRIRNEGLPNLALEWSELINDEIEEKISTMVEKTHIEQILKLHASILKIQSRALLDGGSARDISFRFPAISKKLNKISKVLKDRNIYGYANYVSGNLLYIRGEYKRMLPFAQKAYEYILDDEIIKHVKLKDIGIYYANSNQKSRFEELKTKTALDIRKMVSKDLTCELMEGMAAGDIVLGNEKSARKWLHEAWKVVDDMEVEKSGMRKIRMVQLTRTNLLFYRRFRTGQVSSEMVRIAKEAIFISDQLGFVRHGLQIKKYLNQMLGNGSSFSDKRRISYID